MRRRTLAVCAITATAVVVTGILFAQRRDTGANAPARAVSAPPDASQPADPIEDEERNERGAIAAAVGYATAPQQWLYFDDEGVVEAVRSIATVSAADRLSSEVREEIAAAREGLVAAAGPVWWLVRPLATNVETHSADSARVSVWVVTILSAADVAMPQSDWRTVTIDLRWERSDWRVDAIRDTAGPTPMLGARDRAWAPEQVDEALRGFDRIGAEP